MRKTKFMFLTIAMTMLMPICAYARTGIGSVSVRMSADGFHEEWGAEVTAEAKGEHYEVTAIERYDDNKGYSEEDNEYGKHDNRYVVTLATDDEEYYFNTTKTKNIHVSGLSADFVSASRRDNGTTLIITLDIDDSKVMGYAGELKYDGAGRISWDDVRSATWYKIKVIDSEGKRQSFSTNALSYDLAPALTEAGTYEVSFTPRSDKGETSGESEPITIDVSEEQAALNKAKANVEKIITYPEGEDPSPGNQIITYQGAGWQQEADGRWWFKNNDGTYPQGAPLKDYGDPEYFFDEEGYMIANATVKWKGVEYKADETGRLSVVEKKK